MKSSDLIFIIQSIIEKHGDVDVSIFVVGMGDDGEWTDTFIVKKVQYEDDRYSPEIVLYK